MKFKRSYHIKTKVISVVSAIVLWLYVISAVDPQEQKTYTDIPISISNLDEIKSKGYVVYPEIKLTSSMSVKAPLSNLQKLNSDNLIITGKIQNPMEGKNIVYLKTDLDKNIDCKIKTESIEVNLEPIQTNTRPITIYFDKKYKEEGYEIKASVEKVDITGAKSLVDCVYEIVGELSTDLPKTSFSETVRLTALNKNGKSVEGIKLSDYYVNVSVQYTPIEKESSENKEVKDKDSANESKDKNDSKNDLNNESNKDDEKENSKN